MTSNPGKQTMCHDNTKYRAQASKAMIHIARKLRQSQTTPEDIMWTALRNRRLDNLKFRRQHPVAETSFVADFFCYRLKLIIEIDGKIHDTRQDEDKLRQSILESLGYHVLRVTNRQVLNETESVLFRILHAADKISSQT